MMHSVCVCDCIKVLVKGKKRGEGVCKFIDFRSHCTGVAKKFSVIYMEALSPWVGIL